MNEPHNLPVELEKWAYLYFNVFILIHLLVAKKKKTCSTNLGIYLIFSIEIMDFLYVESRICNLSVGEAILYCKPLDFTF